MLNPTIARAGATLPKVQACGSRLPSSSRCRAEHG
jgi:hypothetical protein